MDKNEFYLRSLELVTIRNQKRVNENRFASLQNEIDYIFIWMLFQFYSRMESSFPPRENYRIEFNGIKIGNSFGLRYNFIAEYTIKYVKFYNDFISVLKNVVDIFNQHPNFNVTSFHFPHRETDIERLSICLEFSIDSRF